MNNIKNENIIWYTYILIAIAALISNYFEEHFFNNKTKEDYKIYHNINIIILIVSILTYCYFIYINYQNYKSITPNTKPQKKRNIELNLYASVFVLIAGLLYLYTTINDSTIDEIAII